MPYNSGQSSEQEGAYLCEICKPLQPSATPDRTLVAGAGVSGSNPLVGSLVFAHLQGIHQRRFRVLHSSGGGFTFWPPTIHLRFIVLLRWRAQRLELVRGKAACIAPLLKSGWVTPTYARVSTTGLRSIEVDNRR